MEFPVDQLKELKELCPGVKYAEEGGKHYFPLPHLQLPDGATPSVLDCLLCASERDGYACRLFFSRQVTSPRALNWNAQNVPILGGTWFAFSWRIHSGLRLAQMVAESLIAFR